MQRFIVADDHPLFREGLVRILRQLQPQARVDQADSLQQVLELARRVSRPAGLLLDLLYPGQDLSFSLRALRQEFKRSTLIVVSMLEDATVIEHILQPVWTASSARRYRRLPWPRRSPTASPDNLWCAMPCRAWPRST